MNVNSADYQAKEVKKSVFNLKPIHRDGLILQIHHTVQERGKPRRIRFLYTAFDSTGLLVANADISGNIFIVDFACNKFWLLTNFRSCSVVAFSSLNSNELLVGTQDGGLFVLHIHLGEIVGVLEGHKYPVKHVSFANEHCLTASAYEAIIYDLATYTKLHELTLVHETVLKQVTFMPITNNVLVCFCDDFIHVWKYKSFESYKQSYRNYQDGTSMVLAGHSATLIVFSLDAWQVTRVLHLPAGINTVRSVHFLAYSHDAGANKFLVVLSGDGVLYFLDMEHSFVVGRLQPAVEVVSFTCAPTTHRLSCVLHSGEVNVYRTEHYVHRIRVTQTHPTVSARAAKVRLCVPKQQCADNWDPGKLRAVLRVYGEFPASYRAWIWAKLLQLPDNRRCYACLAASSRTQAAPCHPLKSRPVRQSLHRLLSNLAAWCPAVARADFMPLFVFPFVRVFETEPVRCFEAVLTIILNWCQHWFQYLPERPVNVLAMVETVLHEHDAPLLAHLVSCEVTSLVYAWPLLATAFSEVLSGRHWAVLWDNVLAAAEPALLLALVVAYSVLCRAHLLRLRTAADFDAFYRTEHAVSVHRLLAKAQHLLKHTSDRAQPGQYLRAFTGLPAGSYPVFVDYPRAVAASVAANLDYVHETQARLQRLEAEVCRHQETEEQQRQEAERHEEEARRLQDLEVVYEARALRERQQLEHQRLQVSRLRTSLHERQAEALERSRARIEAANLHERQRTLSKLLATVDRNQAQADLEVQTAEEQLSKQYVALLEQRERLAEALATTKTADDEGTFAESRHRLNNELDAIRRGVQETRLANRVQVPAAISALEQQLQELDLTAAKRMAAKQQRIVHEAAAVRMQRMESDTAALESDVQRLLQKLDKVRTRETCNVARGECRDVGTREATCGPVCGCYCSSE